MNFALTDEQRMLREAAAGALGRHETVAAARAAARRRRAARPLADRASKPAGPGSSAPRSTAAPASVCSTRCWSLEECRQAAGRRRADRPSAGDADRPAGGEPGTSARRSCSAAGLGRASGPRRLTRHRRSAAVDGRSTASRGSACRRHARRRPGQRRGGLPARRRGRRRDRRVDQRRQRRCAMRSLRPARASRSSAAAHTTRSRPVAHSRRSGRLRRCSRPAPATRADAWYLGPGAARRRRARRRRGDAATWRVAYAKDRNAFGRPIGSYQAVKHQLVEILRLESTARSLIYYAGLRPSRQARGARARRARRPLRRRAGASTTRRARTSPSTAASAPPGSTTRPSTGAGPSSRGCCSAATAGAPTAWPRRSWRRRAPRRGAEPDRDNLNGVRPRRGPRTKGARVSTTTTAVRRRARSACRAKRVEFAVEQERIDGLRGGDQRRHRRSTRRRDRAAGLRDRAGLRSRSARRREVIPGELLMRVVHGEQDFRFHQPIRPGMTLVSRRRADRRAPALLRRHRRRQGRDARQATGELVDRAVHDVVRPRRPGRRRDRPARRRPTTAFPEALRDASRPRSSSRPSTRTRPSATRRRRATRCRSTSTTSSPKAMGLPGIIIHGLCTMAFTSRAVIETRLPRRPDAAQAARRALLEGRASPSRRSPRGSGTRRGGTLRTTRPRPTAATSSSRTASPRSLNGRQ